MIDVSIIIPTKNRKAFLEEAIASCLQQKNITTEIIIINDGSTDDTDSIFSHPDQKIRYFSQMNLGPAVARNVGMKHARGEFIKFLDDDDLLEPDSVTEQVRVLRQTQSDLAYGPWQFCTEQKIPLGKREGSEEVSPSLDFLLSGMWYPCYSYLYRRSFLEEHHCQWNEAFYYLTDLQFILTVASHSPKLQWFDGMTGWYRRHNDPSKQLSGILWQKRDSVRLSILRDMMHYMTAMNAISALGENLLTTKSSLIRTYAS